MSRPWPRWATPLCCVLLAVVWTWPALSGLHLLGHHPDAPGTAWFLSASARMLSGGFLDDPLTGWPTTAHYGRPDSFLQLPIGALLSGIGAARLLSWLTVAGVALSAWAAERFARELGARPPWSLLAGGAFALSGLASTAMLEGYPYHLLNPWMPLFATAWLRATRDGGRLRDGLFAALWFTLALLDTAWLAIASVPIAVGFALPVLASREQLTARLKPMLAAALAVLMPAIAYALLFKAGGGAGSEDLATAGHPIPDLGQTLRRLLPPSLSIDLHGYTQSATLPATALALSVAAPRVLGDKQGWQRVALTGAAAIGLVLLPSIVLGKLGQDGVLSVILAAFQRFPDRLSWASLLCFGAVGAVVLTRVADRRPKAAWLLLGLGLIDAFIVPRLPWRQRSMITEVPSIYQTTQGPVLDVWPANASKAPAWDLWTTNLGCYYQSVHQRPIADLCIVSPGQRSPRLMLQRAVVSGLLSGEAAATADTLRRLGFSSLVVHAGLFQPSDRARLLAALDTIGGAVDSSTDGGEWLVAVALNDAPVAERTDALAHWQEWTSGQP